MDVSMMSITLIESSWVILAAFMFGFMYVRWTLQRRDRALFEEYKHQKQRDDWKALATSSGVTASNLTRVAEQLRKTYEQPFSVRTEQDKVVLQHYAGLSATNHKKHSRFSDFDRFNEEVLSKRRYTSTDPVGDYNAWAKMEGIRGLGEELFGDRCQYCGTLQVKDTHCPSCGGAY